MTVYTRTGDKGQTSLFNGERVSKDNSFVNALGVVDECNSAIGASLSFFPDSDACKTLKERLVIIQHALFDVGAALATPRTRATEKKLNMTRFDEHATEKLEQWIDEMDKELPELHAFILPGGHPSGAMLHLARTFCRTAERMIVPLNHEADVADCVFTYMNRLSDFLFVASRYVNHAVHCPEVQWQHHVE